MNSELSKDEVLKIGKLHIALESRVVAALEEQLGESFYEAAQLMLACEGHVLTSGSGTSHTIAARFAHLLSCVGTPSLYIHPSDSLHGTSGAVTEKDVVFFVSKGGETTEVNGLAKIAKARGAKVICIVENPASTLAGLSDVVLCVKAPSEADIYGMISLGSSIFNAALCDALCAVLLEMRGYTKDEFGETHPGGAVGIKLKNEEAPQDE